MFREVPFGQDGNVSHEAIINRINSDLANNFGNLIHRTISFCMKNIGNEINFEEDFLDENTHNGTNSGNTKDFNTNECDFMHWRKNKDAELEKMMDNYEYHKYLEEVMMASKEANQYIDNTKPWEMKKDLSKENEMKKVMFLLLKRIYDITYYLTPFMPTTCKKIMQQLGFCEKLNKFSLSNPEQIFAKIEVGEK
jgi:methionyl-tRNA synthetase